MSDVVEFLLARVAEDEAMARDCIEYGVLSEPGYRLYESILTPFPEDGVARDLADRFGPARVLAECEAKRAIAAIHELAPSSYPDADRFPFGCSVCHFDDNMQFGHGPCETLLSLARIWSDHPDFDPAWAADTKEPGPGRSS